MGGGVHRSWVALDLEKTCQTCKNFGRLFHTRYVEARILGRWVGPSIDQGWHLTRPLAPSGPSVIPCNGPTPDNDTRIGEGNLFAPTHSSPTITMFVGHQSFHPHRVYHHLEPLIVEHHILSNGNRKQGRVEDNQNQDHMGHRIGFEGR